MLVHRWLMSRSWWLGVVLLLVGGWGWAALGAADQPAQVGSSGLPVLFVANEGQWPEAVRFRARAAGTQALFLEQGVNFWIKRPEGYQPLGLRARAPSDQVRLQPGERLETRFNLLRGGDKARSRSNIPTYSGVTYQGLLEGVDWVFRTEGRSLVYDFVVHPGADPARIEMAVPGARALAVNAQGELLITLDEGEPIRQSAPVIYQEVEGQRQLVSGQFRVLTAQAAGDAAPVYGFEVAEYDRSRELVIDPTLEFFAYGGGANDEVVTSMWVDTSGNSYVAGTTESTQFYDDEAEVLTPLTNGDEDGVQAGTDGFIYVVGDDGSLDWVTVLAGDGDDEIRDFVVGSGDEIYLTGITDSENFATPLDATYMAIYPQLLGGTDAFIARMTDDGSELEFSTYYGGTEDDAGTAIALDPTGKIYVAGMTESTDLPLRNPAAVYSEDLFSDVTGFILRMTATGSLMEYSTYFGGDGSDEIKVIDVSPNGDIFIAGNTDSENFPAGFPENEYVFDRTQNGGIDMFAARLRRGGKDLVFSTFIGGDADDTLTDATRIRAEDNDNFHYLISGYTESTAADDFPLINAIDTVNDGEGVDAVLAKLDWTGTFLHFSTFLGGRGEDYGFSVAADNPTAKLNVGVGINDRNIYLGGQTDSNVFPFENLGDIPFIYDPNEVVQNYHAGNGDGFITQIGACGQVVYYSTYFGGTELDRVVKVRTGGAVNPDNDVFFAGNTESSNSARFPPQKDGEPAESPDQENNAGGLDTFTASIVDMNGARILPELHMGCNLVDVVSPTGPQVAVDNDLLLFDNDAFEFPITFKKPATGGENISSFRTTVYYDPDVLAIEFGSSEDNIVSSNLSANSSDFIDNDTSDSFISGIRWGATITGLTANDYQVRVSPRDDGELEIEVQQFTSPVVFQNDNDIANLRFKLVDDIEIDDDPISRLITVRFKQQASAVDNDGLDTVISGVTGSKLMRLRCNNWLGDCDCSGRVELNEFTAALDNFVNDSTPVKFCQKWNYDSGTAMDNDNVFPPIPDPGDLGTADMDRITANYLEDLETYSSFRSSANATAHNAVARQAMMAMSASASTAGLDFGAPRVSGTTAEVDLLLDTAGLSITTLGTQVVYNSAAASVDSVQVGSAARDAGKELDYNAETAGQIRILITGLNRNTIASGTVGTIRFNCTSNCADLQLMQYPEAAGFGEEVPITTTSPLIDIGSGDDTPALTGYAGMTQKYRDIGGEDTYTLMSEMRGPVEVIDNQASTIVLPQGLAISASRFASSGVEFTINGHSLKLLGRPDLFTFNFADAVQRSLSETAELFGVSATLGDTPATGNSGVISSSGGLQ